MELSLLILDHKAWGEKCHSSDGNDEYLRTLIIMYRYIPSEFHQSLATCIVMKGASSSARRTTVVGLYPTDEIAEDGAWIGFLHVG